MALKKEFSMANTMSFGNINIPASDEKDTTISSRPEDKTPIVGENRKDIEPPKSSVRQSKSKQAEQPSIPNDVKIKPQVENRDPAPVPVASTDIALKTTSLLIHRKIVNFLAYSAKMSDVSQNKYLEQLIRTEMLNRQDSVPDFEISKIKRDNTDMITKGIKMPDDVLAWAKKRAAMELKSLSEYIEDLLSAQMDF